MFITSRGILVNAKQTDGQINAGKNITSLAELIICQICQEVAGPDVFWPLWSDWKKLCVCVFCWNCHGMCVLNVCFLSCVFLSVCFKFVAAWIFFSLLGILASVFIVEISMLLVFMLCDSILSCHSSHFCLPVLVWSIDYIFCLRPPCESTSSHNANTEATQLGLLVTLLLRRQRYIYCFSGAYCMQ